MIDVKARIGYNIVVDDREFFLDYKKYRLLNSIKDTESMVKASEVLGISYRTTLNYINQIEEALKISIVDTKKGGTGGGGSTILSSYGRIIIKECEKINALLELHQDNNEMDATVIDIKRESNIMQIRIDENIELTVPFKEDYKIGDKILVLISYDSIFISLEPYNSSVRNIFKGKIVEMGVDSAFIRFKIDINGTYFYSNITEYAQEDLNLKLNDEVYIGFKAASIATMKL